VARRRITILSGGKRRTHRGKYRTPKTNRRVDFFGVGNRFGLNWLFGPNRTYRRK